MTRKAHIAAVTCAENIALNYLLHEVPAKPQQKPTRRAQASEPGYLLPFAKEQELVEILSFLAKTKDGADHIPAVCVEQDLGGTGLKALLAINKSTYADGNGLLQTLKMAFENIFKILKQSLYERGSSTDITKQLLEAIVQMCSSRIACRLRLTGKKFRLSRPSIKDMLQKAMEGTRQIDLQRLRQSNLEGSLSLFREKSKRVIQSVNEWSKHRVLFRLQDLVEKIYQLSNVHGLQQMLELIPSGPTKIIKESVFATALLNIIWKVSRYQEAAQVLHRIAKKFPVVRTIELRLATLPPEAFDRPHYPNYSPSLSTALSRLGKIEGKQYRLTQVSQFMTSDKTKNPNDQFAEQTTKTLQEAKIHAEVQLLAYCEIQSPPLFPRAIGSSKDACFLCHALIQRHGKMHTSRTHGRLYPGWRLPLLLSFKTLEHQFNQVLQNHARQTIQARAQGQASARPQPNESTLLPMVVSASTLTAIPDPIEVTQIISEHEAVVSSVSPIPAVVESEVSITNPPEMKTPPVEIETYLRALVRESAGEVVLAASEPFTGILSPTASSPLFLAGPLHVHLEMEASSTCEAAKCLAYSIERIAIDQVLELPAETLTVNVVDLEREVTYALPADGTFRITACDVAVQVGCESSS